MTASKFIFLFAFALSSMISNGQGCGPYDAPMNTNNNQDGIMFDVTALTDVFIDSVWTNFGIGTIPSIEIYYKAGTFVGFQGTAAAWTLLSSTGNVTSAGVNNYTHVPLYLNFQILSGQTYAFYITSTGTSGPYMLYTNGPGGSVAGALYSQTPEIQVSYGNGKDYPFGTSFSTRIFNGKIFYTCCPPPPPIQGPVSGPNVVCQGDTVQYEVPWDSLAVNYLWQVGPNDSIIGGQGDSLITVAIGANSSGGSVCVAYEDTCAFTDTICYNYTINLPPVPLAPTGQDTICEGNSAWYSIPAQAGALAYDWTVDNGATILSNIDSTSVEVMFNNGGATNVCASYFDGCASSTPVCLPINVSHIPTTASAGPDQVICSNNGVSMAAAATVYGIGTWTIENAPAGGAGVFTNANSPLSSYTGFGAGVHTLRWTVENAPCPVTFDEVQLTIDQAPTADFTMSNVCNGEPVMFTDISASNGASIISWEWDMTSNGSVDYTSQNPVHSYGGVGNFSVTLVVSSAACADTLTDVVSVFAVPSSDFTYSPACEASPMLFADNSHISAGTVDSWEWDFGDGTAIDTAKNPTHFYQTDGWYEVTITSYSDHGCSSSHTDSVQAYANPDINFNINNGCQHDTFMFKSIYSSTDGNVVHWMWDFGDGSAQVNDTNTRYKFAIPAEYGVLHTVATNLGCTSTVTKTVKVYPVPVPDFSLDGECERQKMTFVDETQLDTLFASSVTKWEWQFGDGLTDIHQNPVKYFANDGEFIVELTPYSNYGCHETVQKKVTVRPKPDAHVVVLNDEKCAGREVKFRDESFFDYTYDTLGITEWNWQFGDDAISQKPHPTHIYKTGGKYRVHLMAVTSYGCFDSTSVVVEIYHNPVAKFELQNTEGCTPHCPVFIDSSNVADGGKLNYYWSFGDNNISRISKPDHCYGLDSYEAKSHQFLTSLAVETEYGCTDTFTTQELVTVYPAPVAEFDIRDSRISMIDPILYFSNSSFGGDYYLWDFGDGRSSELAEPGSHTYSDPGEYTIQLTTTSDLGCVDATAQNITVDRHQTIFIPNAFSPNSDIINDYWEVYGEDIEYVKIRIFDRWGRVVYEGQDEAAKWDGKINGNPAPIGVYGYFVEYRHIGGLNQKEEGRFLLAKNKM